ncbi:hypothetical protein DWZ87_18870 [Roseburia intestinalis]|nr:hypothetical protein DWZ87_18870 [Roseburia intestinalis]
MTIPGRCAQPLTILPDGFISQTEMTSCGLNGVFLLVKSLKEKFSSIPLQLLAKNEKILILANRNSIISTYCL